MTSSPDCHHAVECCGNPENCELASSHSRAKARLSIEAGSVYVFEKSGSDVRAMAPGEPYCGRATWLVERVSGSSAGKRMIVPEGSLTIVTANAA
jgi:hypothetical protein